MAFGELILLSVPWPAVPEALKAAGNFDGKTLFSCVNCLKPDFSGLEVGTGRRPPRRLSNSPPAPRWSRPSRRWRKSWRRTPPPDGQQISAFYCGNDPAAKASVASLLRDLDLDPVDAGPLTSARYIEPAGMLCVQLAYGMGMGTMLGMKLLRE